MNKVLFFLTLIFAFVFILSNVSAISIITIDLDESGSAIFLGKTNENPVLPEGVVVKDGKIYGFTSNLTSKEGDLWSFYFSLNNSQLTLILPENSTIEKLESGKISDYGKRISVSNFNSISIEYTSSGNRNYFWIYYVVFAFILVMLLATYFYLNFNKKKKLDKSKIEIIKKVLNERENLIINNLKKSGKIKMSYLRKLTEIPKASFSRHILELEKKKLIKKSGEGKNKFVELSEK